MADPLADRDLPDLLWTVTLSCGHEHGPVDDQWEGPPPPPGTLWWCRWPCQDVATVVVLDQRLAA